MGSGRPFSSEWLLEARLCCDKVNCPTRFYLNCFALARPPWLPVRVICRPPWTLVLVSGSKTALSRKGKLKRASCWCQSGDWLSCSCVWLVQSHSGRRLWTYFFQVVAALPSNKIVAISVNFPGKPFKSGGLMVSLKMSSNGPRSLPWLLREHTSQPSAFLAAVWAIVITQKQLRGTKLLWLSTCNLEQFWFDC